MSRMLPHKKRSIMTDSYVSARHKEWDEALCPICMEHPHNAVLLLCSSHSKGCRPFICDTSNRHSNCLDRYQKLKIELNLQCPLCRGDVRSWKVIGETRDYLNMKTRSCSVETCQFAGNYRELRYHARSVHPYVRPTEVNSSREKAWKQFEEQNEVNDINSAIQSAVPGAVIIGDFVIEDEDNDIDAGFNGSSYVDRTRWSMYRNLLLENRSGSMFEPDFNLNEVPSVTDDDSDSRSRRASRFLTPD